MVRHGGVSFFDTLSQHTTIIQYPNPNPNPNPNHCQVWNITKLTSESRKDFKFKYF